MVDLILNIKGEFLMNKDEATFEKLENDIDLQTYEKAMKEFGKDSKTYSIEEVEDILKIKD